MPRFPLSFFNELPGGAQLETQRVFDIRDKNELTAARGFMHSLQSRGVYACLAASSWHRCHGALRLLQAKASGMVDESPMPGSHRS